MKIVLGNIGMPLRPFNEETFISRHTGRELRKFEADVCVKGDDAEELVRKAFRGRNHEPIRLHSDENEDLGLWKVREASSSYQSGVPIYHHTLELEEWEKLEPEHLQIGAFKLEPYHYDEVIDDDAILITARVVITCEQQDGIFELNHENQYFPVLRVGLSDSPLTMRLGRCVWSRADDRLKQELVLVEKSYDEHERRWARLLYLESRNAQDYLVRLSRAVGSLAQILEADGVLQGEQQKTLRGELAELGNLRLRDFWRVDDLDKIPVEESTSE